MTKIYNTFFSVLLVTALATPFAVHAAPEAAQADASSQPVWKTMTPSGDEATAEDKANKANLATNATSQPTSNTTPNDDGFAKPPPTASVDKADKVEKLTARIVADNATVERGTPITFSIESNQPNLRFYWISNGQKSAGSQFTVNTQALKVGKHRVRATVTNKARVQAHASLFYEVKDNAESNAATNATTEQTDTTTKVIEIPAVNSPVPAPISTPSQGEQTANPAKSDGVIELPAVNVDANNESNSAQSQASNNSQGSSSGTDTSTTKDVTENNDTINTDDTSNDNEGDTGLQSPSLIIPQRLTIVKGSEAVFRSSVSAEEGNKYQWKFAGERSNSKEFSINAGTLETGSYLVHLKVTDKNNVEKRGEATLIIQSVEDSVTRVPNLLGSNLQSAKQQLTSAHLQLGEIKEQAVTKGVGSILEQIPEAGSQQDKGTAINLTVGISAIVPAPDVVGNNLSDAKKQLKAAGLQIGAVSYEINDKAIGIVLSQNPSSGTELSRGDAIELVLGKATPKPLTASIQPTSMVVEQGQSLEFSTVIVEPEVDNNLTFKWNSAELTGTERVFKIDTSGLKTGKYPVSLEVSNAKGQAVSSEAFFEVTAKTTVVPELTGRVLSEVHQILADAGLKLGEVKQRPSDKEASQVLEQDPAMGERLAVGSVVNLIVSVEKQKEATTITLEANTEKLKVGDTVTFTTHLSPQPKGDNIHYVYTMNAEKKANVQPTFQWTPNNEGIYSVAVTAYNDAGVLAKSESLSIDVSPAWEKPIAKILPEMQVIKQGGNAEFVSTATYDLNSTLNYDWSSETSHSGSKKQFMFDTSELDPGSYNINLKVTDDQGNSSTTTAILVVQASVASLDRNLNSSSGKGLDSNATSTAGSSGNASDKEAIAPTIELSLSRHIVSTDSVVKIKALSDKQLNSALYYFEPGDNENTKWLTTNETTHAYKSFGTYLIRGAVKEGDNVYYTDSATIWVWSPLLLIITAGIGLLAYLLMWWWTKFIPKTRKSPVSKMDSLSTLDIPHKAEVIEEQVPLSETSANTKADGNDIVTDKKHKSDETVTSVLKKAIIQFVLGIAISILVLYVILKSTGLI